MALSGKALAQYPKSVTAWLGAAVGALAYFVGAPHDSLLPFVSVEHYEAVLRLAGFALGAAVIVNRSFTDGSLEDKAADPAP